MAPAGRVARFGSFEVDLQSAELWKSGVRIPLQDKPFRLLATLLRHPGELITREQLQRELWADDTFVDFERGLNTAIKRVRDALGDNADAPRFIETLPRRGYRFIATVVEATRSGPPSADTTSQHASDGPRRAARLRAIALAAVAVVAAAIVAALPAVRRVDPSGGVIRLRMPVEPAERFGTPGERTIGGTRTNLAVSPDGRTLAFVGLTDVTRHLYVRRLDGDAASRLAGTAGAAEPFFSPDGAWIGFWSDGYLRKVSLNGGQVATICEVGPYPPMGATWIGGTIVFAKSIGPLLKVPAGGGAPVPFTTVRRGEFGHRLPHALAGFRDVLFTIRKHDYTWGKEEIAVQSLDGSEHKVLLAGSDARYAASGHLVFLRLGTIMAAAFDPDSRDVIGTAVPVINDVAQSAVEMNTLIVSGAGQFAFSETGVLAYVRGGVGPMRPSRLIWLDRHGRVTPADMPPGMYAAPRLSPDGTRIVWFGWETTRSNIWVHDIDRGWSAQLASDDEDIWPIWSPDGRDVIYQSVSGGEWFIKKRAADGTGSPSILTSGPSVTPTSWSSDGSTLGLTMLGSHLAGAVEFDLFTWRRGGRPEPLLRSPAYENQLEFSPASSRYAFVSDESGRLEVYVAAADQPGARFRLSPDGGEAPAWSKNGELFYVAPGTMPDSARVMVVDVPGTLPLRAGIPRLLFESREAVAFRASHPVRNYDVASDGQRFLTTVLDPLPPDRPALYIDVVLNWFDDLRARAKPGR